MVPCFWWIVVRIVIAISCSEGLYRNKRSLFDDLPLNGALDSQDSRSSVRQLTEFAGVKPIKLQSSFSNLPTVGSNTARVQLKRSGKPASTPENRSLFDQLPNQGAISFSDSSSNLSRSTRDSLFNSLVDDSLDPQGVEFDVNRSVPESDFSLSYFNSNFLPPIVNSITKNEGAVVPIITHPNSNSYTSPGRSNSNYYPKSETKFNEPDRKSERGKSYNLAATAKSGGPTVIVYAHPHPNKPGQNQNSEQGAGPPAPPTRRNDRNEVHYHYHLPSTQPPSRSYDRKQYHNQNRHYHQHPPTQSSTPPPQPPPSGQYPNSIRDSFDDDINPNEFNHRTFFAPTRHRPSSNSHSTTGGWNSDTTSPPVSLTYDNHSPNDPILQPPPSSSYNPPSFDAPSAPENTYGPPSKPSSGYGPPPSFEYGHPSPSGYGPPPSPPPSYGPPQNDPPPPPALPPSPAPATEGHQTSISYHTIPVTHQITELVQVPTITQTISSNAPVANDPPMQQDQPANTGSTSGSGWQRPSSGYGSPGRMLNTQGQNQPQAQRTQENKKVDRSFIAEDQLSRLLLSGSQASRENVLSDLLFLSQSQAGNDLSIPELQLLQASLGLGNDFSSNLNSPLLSTRGAGNIFNRPSLRTNTRGSGLLGRLSRLRNIPSLFSGGGTRGNGIVGAPNIYNNQNNQFLLGGNRGAGLSGLGNINPFLAQTRGFGGNNVISADAVSALSEVLRETRLQGTFTDLRSRLREQSFEAERAKDNYRSLFFKGALLLSALTLLPTVATPLAAAATANSVAMPSFMMPLAGVGRKKRSFFEESMSNSSSEELELTPFERCLKDTTNKIYASKSTSKPSYAKFQEWLNCSNNLTSILDSKYLINNSSKNKENKLSLFDDMAFQGAYVPETIRSDLQKYLPTEVILKNSQCLQKYFCSNVLEMQAIPNGEAFLALYSIFANDLEKNPWIQESLKAANNKNCEAFYCHEDYKSNENDKML